MICSLLILTPTAAGAACLGTQCPPTAPRGAYSLQERVDRQREIRALEGIERQQRYGRMDDGFYMPDAQPPEPGMSLFEFFSRMADPPARRR